MHIVLTAPTGYNARELLLPLRDILHDDPDITHVTIITPAAAYRDKLFPTFSNKFSFVPNASTVAEYQSLFEGIQPTLVLTPTIGLDVSDIPILRAAKAAHVPTCTFVASWDNVFKMERLLKRGHSGASKATGDDYELPDFVAVWNELKRDHFLRIFPHFPSDHIAVTGAPRFDYLSHSDRIPSKDELFAYLGFSPPQADQKLIHCATTELYPFEYIVRAIHRASTTHQIPHPLHLYASVHPGGNIKRHASLKHYHTTVRYSFGRHTDVPVPEFQYLPTDKEMYLLVALFKYTDVLVNQSSTVAVESLVADVPIINVTYGQPFDWLRWRRSMVYRDFHQHYRYITDEGGTTLVRNRSQLISAINHYLDNPALHTHERQKTAEKLLTHTDGSASQHLVEFLKKAALQSV